MAAQRLLLKRQVPCRDGSRDMSSWLYTERYKVSGGELGGADMSLPDFRAVTSYGLHGVCSPVVWEQVQDCKPSIYAGMNPLYKGGVCPVLPLIDGMNCRYALPV